MKNVVLYFDGNCLLCNYSLKFLLNRDKQKLFKISLLESSKGKSEFDSIILSIDQKQHTHSTAVIKSITLLGGWYKSAILLFLIPKAIRDFLYKLVAKHRHKYFNKNNSCPTIPAEWKDRFI